MDTRDPRGAIWRRWEPHIHTPGTAMQDRYGDTSLDAFLTAVEAATPMIEAVGITDYLLVRHYEEVHQARENGRLPGVKLLFCNVEMRLSIETRRGKPVNLHILVSPDDPDHITQIKRHLASLRFRFGQDSYSCTEADLTRLGRAHDQSITDDEAALRAGVNQFKVDFEGLRTLYEENRWLQQNTLIAIAGGSTDGTSGLQDSEASFAARRKELETFAHIIFTATPKSIAFWRGESDQTPEQLETTYGGMKPCLHGSDAHELAKVAKPDEDRYCWIKGDASFETLRQACLEPRFRVHLGATPPLSDTPINVASIVTPDLPWLVPNALPINDGMVAIIGARGSGKTALADLIAHAGHNAAAHDDPQSFITRAHPFFDRFSTVEASWSDSEATSSPLLERPDRLPDVHYLTQQFVDRLCSAEAESDELLDEIKRVVFLAHEPDARLGAEDFDSLARLRSSETDLAVEALNQRLDRLSQAVLTERNWHRRRPQLASELEKVKADLLKTDTQRKQLIKPGGKDRAEYYTRLSTAIGEREQAIEAPKRRLQDLRKLRAEVNRYHDTVFAQQLTDLTQAFATTGLTEAEWTEFQPRFSGDPEGVIDRRLAAEEQAIQTAERRDALTPELASTTADLARCSLDALRAARKAIGEQIGIDRKNAQRLEQLNQAYSTLEAKQRRTEEDVKTAQDSPTRLAALLAERGQLYEQFFELTTARCTILSELYEPLQQKLAETPSTARELVLRVIRDVDLESWATAAEENLLDLRKAGEFRGRGALADAARELLLPAWQDGTAAEVAAAMETFRSRYDDELLAQANVQRGSDEYQQWAVDLGRWLYSTDHIRVRYRIEFQGSSITQLSPGTRGIVLLLLYLALDIEDARPLIIDQPEENLDPQSVYTELVALFRDARLRRQVIIVTHNANLVVNTDVDQVIVASCVKHGGGDPPEFTYECGGLEDPIIRRHVCEILEGGEAAFRQRARRLRVALGPPPAAAAQPDAPSSTS